MRSRRSIALLACRARAGRLRGRGTKNKDSASDFTGEEKAVATTVEDLQSAAEDSDERKICSDLIVAELRDAIAENGNAATCVAAMEGVLKDTDQSDLTVRRVSIDGTKASAVVRAKLGDDKSRDETVEPAQGRQPLEDLAAAELTGAADVRSRARARTGARNRRGIRPSGSAPTRHAFSRYHATVCSSPSSKRTARLPAQRPDLLRAQRVAAVVAEAVGDVLDLRLAGAGQLDDPADDVDVRALVGAARVVDLAGRAVLQHVADRRGEVARRGSSCAPAAVAVDRQRVPEAH